MWELGVGGLLAVVVAVRQRRGLGTAAAADRRALVLAWVGPGARSPWTALRRTPARRPSPAGRRCCRCSARPRSSPRCRTGAAGSHRAAARRAGRCSGSATSRYSVYLWHWPLIVLVPQVLGHHGDHLDRLLVVVLTLGARRADQDLRRGSLPHARWGMPLTQAVPARARAWRWWSHWPVCPGPRGRPSRGGVAKRQLAKARLRRRSVLRRGRARPRRQDCARGPYDKVVPRSGGGRQRQVARPTPTSPAARTASRSCPVSGW